MKPVRAGDVAPEHAHGLADVGEHVADRARLVGRQGALAARDRIGHRLQQRAPLAAQAAGVGQQAGDALAAEQAVQQAAPVVSSVPSSSASTCVGGVEPAAQGIGLAAQRRVVGQRPVATQAQHRGRSSPSSRASPGSTSRPGAALIVFLGGVGCVTVAPPRARRANRPSMNSRCRRARSISPPLMRASTGAAATAYEIAPEHEGLQRSALRMRKIPRRSLPATAAGRRHAPARPRARRSSSRRSPGRSSGASRSASPAAGARPARTSPPRPPRPGARSAPPRDSMSSAARSIRAAAPRFGRPPPAQLGLGAEVVRHHRHVAARARRDRIAAPPPRSPARRRRRGAASSNRVLVVRVRTARTATAAYGRAFSARSDMLEKEKESRRMVQHASSRFRSNLRQPRRLARIGRHDGRGRTGSHRRVSQVPAGVRFMSEMGGRKRGGFVRERRKARTQRCR